MDWKDFFSLRSGQKAFFPPPWAEEKFKTNRIGCPLLSLMAFDEKGQGGFVRTSFFFSLRKITIFDLQISTFPYPPH